MKMDGCSGTTAIEFLFQFITELAESVRSLLTDYHRDTERTMDSFA